MGRRSAVSVLHRARALLAEQHARLYSSTSPPTLAPQASTSQHAPSASSAPAMPTSGSDWTTHTNTKFSIRPSLLSPLYSTYRQEQDRQARRQLTSDLIAAHSVLSEELDGVDSVQVEMTAKHRAASLRQLGSELRALAPRNNIAACTDSKHMLGFYSLLESQNVGQSDNASISGAPAELDESDVYRSAATGQTSVWDTWASHFVERYKGVPGLQPLEQIYAKKDIVSSLEKLESGMGSALLGNAGADANAERKAKHGARMDVAGTVLAEGKRKTSVARVLLSPGDGGFTVNGKPYDLYFQNLSVRAHAVQPLALATSAIRKFNLEVHVKGGGPSSQAQAVRTGVARALMLYKNKLKVHEKFGVAKLTRWDGRIVERKKPGRAGARRGFTWVKR